MYAVAYSHSCEDVGKTIKRSKRRYIWKFGFELSEYDIENHEVVLYASLLSGKRQLYIDGEKISSSKGQYGKLQMKFNIDKHQNSGLIQADGDLYTLFINNVQFKLLYQQGNNVNRFASQKQPFQDLESDNEELNEDQINHLNLQEERYNNVVSKLRGKNIEFFNGPIVQQQIAKQGPPEKQFNNRFKSFGLDEIQGNTQEQNIFNVKEAQQNSTQDKNNVNQQKDPFSGFNFNSWIPKEGDQKNQNNNTMNSNHTQSSNLELNNRTNSMSQAHEPRFGTQPEQNQLRKSVSNQQDIKQNQQVVQNKEELSKHDKVFDDFFNHNKNKDKQQQQDDDMKKEKGFSFAVNIRNNSEISERSESKQGFAESKNEIIFMNQKSAPQFGIIKQNTINKDKQTESSQIQNNKLASQYIQNPTYDLL